MQNFARTDTFHTRQDTVHNLTPPFTGIQLHYFTDITVYKSPPNGVSKMKNIGSDLFVML